MVSVNRILDNCLKDFPNIDAVIWAKSGLLNLTRRKDVFAMLPTGFGKSIIFQLFPCVATCPYIWKAFVILKRNVIKNCCFAFVFDHERSSRTVKTTRVLGCNQRNRKRIGRERGKIAFAFCKIVFGSPESWLPKLWMKELEETKLGQQTAAMALDEVPLWQWYGWALHQWSTVQVR